MYVISGNIVRAGLTIPRNEFILGNSVSLSWVNSANSQRYVEVIYKSDTSVDVVKSSTAASEDTWLKIQALGGTASPF